MTYFFKTLTSLMAAGWLALGAISVPVQGMGMGMVMKWDLSSDISMVMTGGYWSSGADEGVFRVVVTGGGVEHVAHRLFIQWLKADPATQSYVPVRTLPVKELNTGHGYVLNVSTMFGEPGAFVINVEARSRGGATRRFMITAGNDGTYSLTPR